ncbi:MAG TPA: cytochrome c biogenesis protein ResB [Dermatophilaceae bacterium]|nr:cytochrome c biogenesis protein ResB [Dermatophilaceae bacterium]
MSERRDVVQPRLGALGWLRYAWRQLTSMRTALFLLLLLAVAALPGSTFPQRSIDPARTAGWIAAHPTAGPVLDRLGFFEVYASPWFAAIYLLLFVSLVGCVVPRSRLHWQAVRSAPPRAPSRLDRLPASVQRRVDAEPEAALAAARAALKARRYRVAGHDDASVSAEKGYLKETGNLVFHLALLGVIVGVAIGHLFGWKGDVIVPAGSTFANTLSRYDTFRPGPWVDPAELKPFTLRVDRVDATFESDVRGSGQFGAPRDFTAYTTFTPDPAAAAEQRTIKVNSPLETGGGSVFLLGNGYAPTITVRDADGTVVYSDATPFLPQDNNYRSVGAVKVPGASPSQLGFAGLFLPTATITEDGPVSIFPQALEPALALTVFEGTLFPDGSPQSVYTLDTSEMTQLTDAEGEPLRIWLTPGQTVQLPGGRGSISLDDVDRFAGLSIRADPGKLLTLASSLLALGALVASLVVHRRRVFIRVATEEGTGRTVVSVGGLAKDDDEGMDDEVHSVADAVTAALPTRTKDTHPA